jgi:hypothetical protein
MVHYAHLDNGQNETEAQSNGYLKVVQKHEE